MWSMFARLSIGLLLRSVIILLEGFSRRRRQHSSVMYGVPLMPKICSLIMHGYVGEPHWWCKQGEKQDSRCCCEVQCTTERRHNVCRVTTVTHYCHVRRVVTNAQTHTPYCVCSVASSPFCGDRSHWSLFMVRSCQSTSNASPVGQAYPVYCL